MAKTDIIQNMVSELGQSQEDRPAKELAARFIDVDERTPVDMAAFAEAYAAFVKHYGKNAGDIKTFAPFFAQAAARAEGYLEAKDGATPPHWALFLTFLELREQTRALRNRGTERHLDFHQRDVLRFALRDFEPDHAHVVFEMKKGAARAQVLPTFELSADKDSRGIMQIYSPARETVIGPASIAEMRSTYLALGEHGVLRSAPVANSADGKGAPLPADAAYFSPLGHPALPLAEVGFALSSAVLRMKEGKRRVTISLWLEGAPTAPADGVFEALLTGEKGWLGPFAVRLQRVGSRLDLVFEIPATETAVVDYAAAIHGGTFVADAPVVEIVLLQGSTSGYIDWKKALLLQAKISVRVEGFKSLVLENDLGKLDPKKAFLPFGAEAPKNARFMIGCEEALSKNVDKLDVSFRWHSLPTNFPDQYQNYGALRIQATDFHVASAFRDIDATVHTRRGIALFSASGSSSTLSLLQSGGARPPKPATPEMVEVARINSGIEKTREAAKRGALVTPTRKGRTSPAPSTAPSARTSFITLSLEQGFLFDVYRRKTAENIRRQAEETAKNAVRYAVTPDEKYLVEVPLITLKEPYSPTVEEISLDYEASTSTVNIESTSESSFANPDIKLFHIDAFGVRREHGYLRADLSFLSQKRVPLLPTHDHAGEFLIGLSNLAPGDSVSLLFRVVSGSANPEAIWPALEWSVLSNEQWRPLVGTEVALDTTNSLRSTGLYVLSIPNDATTESTLLPSGLVWVKLGASSDASQISKLWGVSANGVEVVYQPKEDWSGHSRSLPSGSIKKLLTPITGVKKVSQPDSTFGGRAAETPSELRIRAAERMRHKGRCVTPWDYERMILEAFPSLHRVKCIPHATATGQFLRPGHVLVVVVPDLRGAPASRLLEPRADIDTLESVRQFLKTRTGASVEIAVKNPEYQKVRVDFGVKFRGPDFNIQRELLQKELVSLLSPWATDASRSVSFGGRVYRSAILDFIEERSYVDYVTEFSMVSYTDSPEGALDVSEAVAERPDAVLVSESEHGIREAL